MNQKVLHTVGLFVGLGALAFGGCSDSGDDGGGGSGGTGGSSTGSGGTSGGKSAGTGGSGGVTCRKGSDNTTPSTSASDACVKLCQAEDSCDAGTTVEDCTGSATVMGYRDCAAQNTAPAGATADCVAARQAYYDCMRAQVPICADPSNPNPCCDDASAAVTSKCFP